MNKKEKLQGIWLITMALLSVFIYIMYYVSRMYGGILRPWYMQLLIVLMCVALFLYMWGPEKINAGPLKVLYRILFVCSFAVIPAFIFVFSGLYSQYHVAMPYSIDASDMPVSEILPQDETVVYNTGELYVIFPEYSNIEIVLKDSPSKSDESITWCCGAIAHRTTSLFFDENNLEGDYAVKGVFHDSPYDWDEFGAFTFADGKYAFEFDDPTGAVKEAAEKGGSGYMHFALFKDGEQMLNFSRPRPRGYRALAELNGNLCIIDAVNLMDFPEFAEKLKKLGVTNALYMDMGSGWNYSWLRLPSGEVKSLFGLPVPWSHNWLVFRK